MYLDILGLLLFLYPSLINPKCFNTSKYTGMSHASNPYLILQIQHSFAVKMSSPTFIFIYCFDFSIPSYVMIASSAA